MKNCRKLSKNCSMHDTNCEISSPYNFWTPVKSNIPDVWSWNFWTFFGSEIEVWGWLGGRGRAYHPPVATPWSLYISRRTSKFWFKTCDGQLWYRALLTDILLQKTINLCAKNLFKDTVHVDNFSNNSFRNSLIMPESLTLFDLLKTISKW